MQVSVESTSSLERKMTVEVPSARIDDEVEKRLRSMAPRVKVDGFRPGKVPFRVVKQRYGRDVYQEVLGRVLEESFREAVSKEALRPAGSPQIEAKTVEPGKALEYIATFEVYPEFDVAGIEDIEISRPSAEVAEGDIDNMIETLRKQRMSFEAVERPSKEGDQMTVDFEGSLDGVPFEGGKGEKATVVLGQGRMIEDFERQLAGLEPGQETTIDVTFPENYHAENLAGKTVQFAIKVHEVAEPRLPEVDDEFVKAFGVQEGGVEALRSEVKANMERELAQAIKGKIKSQVMDGLNGKNQLDVPKALISEEIGRMRQQMMSQFGAQDAQQFPDQLFEEEARRRVSLGLIIAELVKKEQIQVDRDRVEETLKDLASSYEEPQQVIEYYRRNPQAMSQIEAMVLEDQVVDWVLDRVKVTDEETTFDSLMNPANKGEQSE